MGAVTEEGLDHVLDVYFATPGDFYVGLCSDVTIAKSAVYTDLTEVSGSGYALIALTTITVSVNNLDNRKALEIRLHLMLPETGLQPLHIS